MTQIQNDTNSKLTKSQKTKNQKDKKLKVQINNDKRTEYKNRIKDKITILNQEVMQRPER